MANETHCQSTLSEFQNIISQYCDSINYGWYSSEKPMTNGDFFRVYIGPLDNDLEGQYIEKNMWGTFYGKWNCYVQGIGDCEGGDCFVHISLDDSIDSQNNLCYNGDEKYPCWWTTMYFYSKCDTLAAPFIEIRDRTGELVPIYYIKLSDSHRKTILFQDQYGRPLPRCIIPPETKYIEVSGKDPNVARGQCEYTPGAGNVTFVILPTANDYRLLFREKSLEYYPLDQWSKPDNNKALNLLFESRSME